MKRKSKLSNDKFLQLILNLHKHALGENRPDFIYFYYWNILETIARHKGYDTKKKPNGVVKLDKKGNPVRVGAADMVRLLIKETYAKTYNR